MTIDVLAQMEVVNTELTTEESVVAFLEGRGFLKGPDATEDLEELTFDIIDSTPTEEEELQSVRELVKSLGIVVPEETGESVDELLEAGLDVVAEADLDLSLDDLLASVFDPELLVTLIPLVLIAAGAYGLDWFIGFVSGVTKYIEDPGCNNNFSNYLSRKWPLGTFIFKCYRTVACYNQYTSGQYALNNLTRISDDISLKSGTYLIKSILDAQTLDEVIFPLNISLWMDRKNRSDWQICRHQQEGFEDATLKQGSRFRLCEGNYYIGLNDTSGGGAGIARQTLNNFIVVIHPVPDPDYSGNHIHVYDHGDCSQENC
jgi:hypothetical protein